MAQSPLTTQKISSVILFIALAILSVAISFLISEAGEIVAYGVLAFLFGVTILIATFTNFRTGFLIMVVYAFFLFHIGRVFRLPIPLGVIMEIFYALLLVSILVNKYRNEDGEKRPIFKNPVGYAILAYVGYMLLEFLNPNSVALAPRLLALREIFTVLSFFFIAMNVFNSFEFLKFFTKFWLFLALLVALYALKQEYIGLQGFELRWLHETPERFKLAFIWGHLRKWSFLSDISAFGLFAAYSGLICGILSMGPFQRNTRIILGISSMLMLFSMTFSGTRTATAMVVIGVVFFILLTINNRRTLIFAAASVIIFLGLLYGPFYGSTLTRLRSTFNASEDPSMEVRNYKRAWLQPYARAHPMGGGLNTAGSTGLNTEPNHELAGKYDPDSGYLRLALERGWIGLLVTLGVYTTTLMYGIKKYYEVKNPKCKIMYAAYMAGFFSLTIANFAQDAMDQKPIVVLILSSYAIFVRLAEFDQLESSKT